MRLLYETFIARNESDFRVSLSVSYEAERPPDV